MEFSNVEIIEQRTFLDYIIGGAQLKVNLGIDFSDKNGEVDMHNSLHRVTQRGGTEESDYSEAMQRCLKSI